MTAVLSRIAAVTPSKLTRAKVLTPAISRSGPVPLERSRSVPINRPTPSATPVDNARDSRLITPSLIGRYAVGTHLQAVLRRAGESRKIARDGLFFILVKGSEKAIQSGIDGAAMSGGDVVQLAQQVGVVLVAQRRHKTVVVASSVFFMARGTLFAKDRFAQQEAFAVALLHGLGGRQRIEVRGQIYPGLRLVQ